MRVDNNYRQNQVSTEEVDQLKRELQHKSDHIYDLEQQIRDLEEDDRLIQDSEDQISKLKQSVNEYEDVIAEKNNEKDELKNKTIE